MIRNCSFHSKCTYNWNLHCRQT